MTRPKISGLVIGSRKCGTTWVYENFKLDPNVSVSEKVKESGFFSGRMGHDANAYEKLIDIEKTGYGVEIDTSVCAEIDAEKRVFAYNPDIKIVLIVREPKAFLRSRFTHGRRKGEIEHQDAATALRFDTELQRELDYPSIAKTWSGIVAGNQFTILRYEDLETDPIAFYARIKQCLGIPETYDYRPFSDKVNVARQSRLPFVTSLLSNAAKWARKHGAHDLVNLAKRTGVMKLVEAGVLKAETSDNDELLEQAIHEVCPGTIPWYQDLPESSAQ